MPRPTKVTAEQVLAWLGDECTLDECADIIASIANGEYKPTLLRQEVSGYDQGDE
jgi:hypothetical protein